MPTSSTLCRLNLAGLAGALLLSTIGCDSEPLPIDATAGASGSGEVASGGQPSSDPVRTVVMDQVVISSVEEAEHFQHATAEVDFGDASVASATLRVALTSPCFPFSNWVEQGVPLGQRWPARCDAFDRTLSVTLDDPSEDETQPGLELVRAITPFGGPMDLEVDITDVVNGLPGAHRLRLTIDTWSDAAGMVSGSQGEWIASVELSLTPGAAPRTVLAVVPLVLESQTQVDAAALELEVPAGVGSAHIEYLPTGHGGVSDFGCIGPAEEFCQRTHTLRLDGALLSELVPWRDDCATLCTTTQNDVPAGPQSYCAENPCGDPSSVRASRANWCPGSRTAPSILHSDLLSEQGTHELTRRVDGLREGGQWRVSATYFAYE